MQTEAVQDYAKQIHLLQAQSDKPATTNEMPRKVAAAS